MIDQQLIKKCLKGNRKMQYKLYSHCYALLMPIGMRYYGNKEDASSAVNLVVVKVMDKRKLWKDGVPFAAWVKRMYINMALDTYRKEKRKFEVDREYAESRSLNTTNEAEQHLSHEAIHSLVNKLPGIQQKVFQLFAVDGYNHHEIGTMLNITEGNSRYHLHTARQKLQQAILNQNKLVGYE